MLYNIPAENTVMLYWDLPENFKKGNRYRIMSENSAVGETEKCHFKVTNLSEKQRCHFSVFMVDDREYEEKIGEVVCETEKTKKKIDITKEPYNAVGDGKTLNTKCIQKAIDDCKFGECVYIPQGDFMTGALRLHSDMELYLEKGAILHGTCDVKDYEPKIKSRFEGIEMMSYAGLINIGELSHNGYTCRNVKILGEGTIYGGGLDLAENVIACEKVRLKDYLESLGDTATEFERTKILPGRTRPRLINVSSAQNVVIGGITISNGASWNVHMIYSDNIVTYGCSFQSKMVWNGDGWDPDSSTNCVIFGCEFFTGDDAVAIKSGKNPEGNVINRPCEHIRVFDCISYAGHGVTIGSEMSGGISDVRIWNCDLKTSLWGVEIKGTKKRGGYVRDVHVSYTDACAVFVHSVSYNDDGETAGIAPVFENCRFENMELTGIRYVAKLDEWNPCNAIEIVGFDEPGHFVKNIQFKNITIDRNKEGKKQMISLQHCEGISFENLSCK